MTATLLEVETRTALSDLPTVTLDELLVRAELQTRIDRKYVLDASLLAPVLAKVDDLRVLDIDQRRTFGYLSVYFDTPQLEAFYGGGQGRRRRFKVRTRVYLESDDAMLEVKTRGPRGTTVKTRLPYDLADADRLTPAGRTFVAATLRAHQVTDVRVGELTPSLQTTYRRSTLLLGSFGTHGSASRATIDTDLAWRRPGPAGARVHGGPMVIVETKGGATPSALDRALWRHGIRPSTISKYGTGLAALDDALPDLKWHRTLTRHFPMAS